MTAQAVAPDGQGPVRATLERPAPLREHIAQAICLEIVSGTLRPGQRLVEVAVAASLGAGRSSVREAFQLLEEQGILESSSYKGTHVADLGPRQIEEVYSLRAAIEEFLTTRALARGALTPAVVAELETIVREMAEASARHNLTRMIDLDGEFHERIARAADHALALHALVGVRRQARVIIALSSRGGGPEQMVESHRELLAALRSGDAAAAREATRTHVLESGALMARLREGAPAGERVGGA